MPPQFTPTPTPAPIPTIDPAQAALLETARRIKAEQEARKAQAAQQQQQGIVTGLAGYQGRDLMDAALGLGSAAPTGITTGAAAFPGAAASQTLGGSVVEGGLGSGMLEGAAAAPSTTAPFATSGAAAQSNLAAPAATGGYLAPVIGGALALHGGYKSIRNFGHGDHKGGMKSGAEMGAGIGTIINPGLGTAVGAGIGAVAGGLLGSIKTGKHGDQMDRDDVRKRLQENGVLDADFNVTLADGSKYNIGVDGGARLTNMDGKSERRPYNTDGSNPLTPNTVAMANPLAFIVSGGDQKLMNDFSAYFTNAALSNSKDLVGAKANLQGIYNQIGAPKEAYIQAFDEAVKQGKLDQKTADIFKNSLNSFNFPTAGGGQSGAVTASINSQKFDAWLNASIKQSEAAAAQAKQQAKKGQILNIATNMPAPQKISSSPVRTGVQELDSILSGVLG